MDKIEEQQAHQAPPPAFLRSVIEQSEKEPQVDPGVERDKILADGSDSDFWKILKKFVEAKQIMLAKELRENSKDASVEETGFRFLILDQVNTFAAQIISFVEAPKAIYKIQQETKK